MILLWSTFQISLSPKTHLQIKDFFFHTKNCDEDEVAKKYKLNLGIHLFLLLKIPVALDFRRKQTPSQMLSHGRLEDTWCGVAWPLKSDTSRTGQLGIPQVEAPRMHPCPKISRRFLTLKSHSWIHGSFLGCVYWVTCRFQGWWQWNLYWQYLYLLFTQYILCLYVLLISSFCI